MEYKNVKFEAIIATPGCGKSYVCDKYPDKLVDVDEVRLRTKYEVPLDITRDERERTKGSHPFKRRYLGEEITKFYEELDRQVALGKTLIAAPHPESFNYLLDRNIKFCFVYPAETMKEELVRRFTLRGNNEKFIKENSDKFEEYIISNKNEKRCVISYEFSKDEYLEDIMKKFGFDF